VKSLTRNLGGLGDFLESQMKLSTHYCFVKSPGGNLAGPGDFLKSQNNNVLNVSSKALGRFLAASGTF